MKYGMLDFPLPYNDTSRKIIHMDMDAFYASIEIRDNPRLKNKPVVIARHPKETQGRGIVTTCNYIARKYGIHSAMTAKEAYERCPHAVFVPVRMSYYKEVSKQIHQILNRYTSIIEPLSLDEAYLDVTENNYNMPSATIIARSIQQAIFKELNLTCSLGVSYNKFLAKIASDYKKPNGITVITPDQAQDFLMELPIEDFYGVGKKSVPTFHEMGVYKGSDLYQLDLETLIDKFGKLGKSLYFKVRGIHNAPVEASRERKSVGHERTFKEFLEFTFSVERALNQLTEMVVKRLETLGEKATVVSIKIRYADFNTVTRQKHLDKPTSDLAVIKENVLELWRQDEDMTQAIRLLGVSVSGFNTITVEKFPLDIDQDSYEDEF